MPTTRGSRRDFAALEARRFEAAQLFRRGLSQNAVARKLGVSVTAAHRWFHVWRARGRRGLLARVFALDVFQCPVCGGRRRIVGVHTEGERLRVMLERLGLVSAAPARSPP